MSINYILYINLGWLSTLIIMLVILKMQFLILHKKLDKKYCNNCSVINDMAPKFCGLFDTIVA